MLRKQIMAGFAALLILAIASVHGQHSVKGYELYSWKVKGKWHYSLLVGSNRAKTYDEIISKNAERIGSEELEDELKKIPKGEEVVWMGDAPMGAKRSETSKDIDLKHPTRKRIERIKAICDRLGIRLKLA